MIYLQNAFDIPTLILLIFILLILFGSSRVKDIAKNFGEAIREFRKAMSETDYQTKSPPQQIRKAMSETDYQTKSPPQQTTQQQSYTQQQPTQKYEEDPLIEAARRRGISVEGKTRVHSLFHSLLF